MVAKLAKQVTSSFVKEVLNSIRVKTSEWVKTTLFSLCLLYTSALALDASSKIDGIDLAMKTVLEEAERARRFGFTASE